MVDILCLCANPILMNECDAPESNNTYAGWESMVNIPAIIGSPYGISSALVKLTYPKRLTGTFFLILVLLTRRELAEG
jgi:hypothetical protein